jgi:hypothetical protein
MIHLPLRVGVSEPMTDLDDFDDDNEMDNSAVVSAIERLRGSIEKQPRTAHKVAYIACVYLIYMLISSWAGEIWNSKFVLSARYDVPTSQITIAEEPLNCNFLRAPLGVKECWYRRRITVIKTGTNAAGEHFVSYDDGKTWSPNTEQTAKSGVMVWWEKQSR